MPKDLAAFRAHKILPLRKLLSRRTIIWTGVVVLGVLALAYFDGGEEPIRPIEQPVDLSGIGAESE